ncbi:MAG: DnaJ C-terminal domain-containing protein [Rubrivivax sp.]|jgi:curved DNA-binding protein
MALTDYYATLGLPHSTTQEAIKRAYRKLARKYHPDVSHEADAEERFKAVTEAHEALIDPERRAAYDAQWQQQQAQQASASAEQAFRRAGQEGATRAAGTADAPDDVNAFFETLFRRGAFQPGRDHLANVAISLWDACHGVQRLIALRMPVADAQGHLTHQERQLDVSIPPGVRAGQHLRLAGQGGPGTGGAPPGDLYLDVEIQPDPVFRLDGSDIRFALPVAPWEAALGADVTVPTPHGGLEIGIPPGSSSGRTLRMKGKGLPGKVPGHLYAVLEVVLPAPATEPEQEAYRALARAFPAWQPRAAWGA